jgi:hypothetical protein
MLHESKTIKKYSLKVILIKHLHSPRISAAGIEGSRRQSEDANSK